MKRITLLMMILTCFSAAYAQETGVNFIKGLSWDEIKAKAAAEHKYIMVDCYATWCGPCKQMDNEVYPKKAIGDSVNAHFISLKLQMDRTKNDDEATKDQYALANRFTQEYAVNAYPTLLFFAPGGELVHKVEGFRGDGFLQDIADAQNPTRQYYQLVNNYKSGTIDTTKLKPMIDRYFATDTLLAGKLALDYLSRIPKANWPIYYNKDIFHNFRYEASIRAMAINFIASFDEEDFHNNAKSDFILAFKDDSAVRQIVLRYITQLNAQQLDNKPTLDFIGRFNDDQGFQQFAATYITALSKKQLDETANLDFIARFKANPKVRQFAISYIAEMNKTQFSEPQNYQFIAQFNGEPQVKKAVNNYLDHLTALELYTKQNIQYLRLFDEHTNDKGFPIFYHHGAQVDTVMKDPNFAQREVLYVVEKMELTPKFDAAKKTGAAPEFDALYSTVAKKYNMLIARKVTADARVNWFKYLVNIKHEEQYWPQLIDNTVEQIKIFGYDTVRSYAMYDRINDICYNYMFKHSDDPRQLDIAISWMTAIVKIDPPKDVLSLDYRNCINIRDTYAAVLYKRGKIADALYWENNAFELSAAQQFTDDATAFKQTWEQMKRGEKIWLTAE